MTHVDGSTVALGGEHAPSDLDDAAAIGRASDAHPSHRESAPVGNHVLTLVGSRSDVPRKATVPARVVPTAEGGAVVCRNDEVRRLGRGAKGLERRR